MSGYSYNGAPPKGWYGAFYPEKKTKGFDELKYYSQIFQHLRDQQHLLPATVFSRHYSMGHKTPDDFSFAIKLWQKFKKGHS